MIPGRIYISDGVIIKRRNYGEADRILTVVTRETGKIRIIAKGVRKVTSRRSGHIELFCRAKLTLHKSSSGTLDLLSEADLLSGSENISMDLVKIGTAYYFSELVDKLVPERQENREVFNLLTTNLKLLQTPVKQADPIKTAEMFANRLMKILGFLPEKNYLEFTRINAYIEKTIEKHLHTVPLLTKISQ
jgi:DNA repair protein RecO (recombination protein O)